MKAVKQKILSKRAILWDFDGCLCDSEPIHYLAYKSAFLKYSHLLNREEYFKTFTHTGEGVLKEIEKYHISCDPEKVRQDKAQFYWDLISQRKASFFKEVPKILELLKDFHLTNAIVSNSPSQEILCILSQNETVSQLIDGIIGIEPGMRKKPAPDLYLKALEVLKLNPSEVLIVEDSERGLWAAEKSGCEAIWIRTELNRNLKTQAPFFKELTHEQFFETMKK